MGVGVLLFERGGAGDIWVENVGVGEFEGGFFLSFCRRIGESDEGEGIWSWVFLSFSIFFFPGKYLRLSCHT